MKDYWRNPHIPTPFSKKIFPFFKRSDSLQAAMYNMTKKQKIVADKHKPPKSAFDSMDEDYAYGDRYDDIGIDIPRGDDW